MKKTKLAKKLDTIILRDSCYQSDIWCAYVKQLDKKEDFQLSVMTEIDNGDCLFINGYLIKKEYKDEIEVLKKGKISYFPDKLFIDSDNLTNLGMDSASIYIGRKITEDTLNIDDEDEKELEYEASIHTGSDGEFGSVQEITEVKNGEFVGIIFEGVLDASYNNEEEVIENIICNFTF